ncbi:MAG: O-methyltransferase [Alphaproteobacteria bacterium]|nr:O-methyltransferase [Alphaproteobacteria bacterium]
MKHGAEASEALNYICELYANEDDLLRNIRETFNQRNMGIQVNAEEGKILYLLLKLHQAHTVVEIGALGGYSAIWMARALPANGHLHTIEGDSEHAELARGFFHQSDMRSKITLWEGRANDMLPRIAEIVPQVDAVFIDADKINYPHYLSWAEAHLKPGGLLIADNTLLFHTVYADAPPQSDRIRASTWQAMRDFNMRLADNKHFDAVMLPTHEGLSIAIRKAPQGM